MTELLDRARKQDEPCLNRELDISPGGVDPLGLRQINFQMMDRVLPGLNNVARHIRPYTVIAWAWRRGAYLAGLKGGRKVGQPELQDFVDRMEVLFVWSQLLNNANSDLPGRDFLLPVTRQEKFRFGGAPWTKMREQRRYSTALSAAVNYGPAVKTLGWVIPSAIYRGAYVSSERVSKALDALERAMGENLAHPVFSQLGSVEVTRDEAREIGKAWELLAPSAEEQDAMRVTLTALAHSEYLDQAVRCIQEANAFSGSSDHKRISVDLCGAPSLFRPSVALADVPRRWRLVQMRQLFRLSLEALLHWTSLSLADGPLQTEQLVAQLLEQTSASVLGRDWLNPEPFGITTISKRIGKLQDALQETENLPYLAHAIQEGLAISLSEQYQENEVFSPDRLPLTRARREADEIADRPAIELLNHILDAWVFGQHTYWAIGRGLGDARSGGKTILRLKIVQDEGGWTLAPGINLESTPRPTPDRLETAVSLMKQASMLQEA